MALELSILLLFKFPIFAWLRSGEMAAKAFSQKEGPLFEIKVV
jgi:hypothetical protein